MHFCAFDVTTDSRADVTVLLKQWTEMAERMTRGEDAVANGAIGGIPMRRRMIQARRSVFRPPG